MEGMVRLGGRVVGTRLVVHGAGQLYGTRQTRSIEEEAKPEIALLNLPNPFERADKNVAPNEQVVANYMIYWFLASSAISPNVNGR